MKCHIHIKFFDPDSTGVMVNQDDDVFIAVCENLADDDFRHRHGVASFWVTETGDSQAIIRRAPSLI